MLDWTLTFLIVAIIAAILGFTGIAGMAAEMARIVFVIAIVIWVASVIIQMLRGKKKIDQEFHQSAKDW